MDRGYDRMRGPPPFGDRGPPFDPRDGRRDDFRGPGPPRDQPGGQPWLKRDRSPGGRDMSGDARDNGLGPDRMRPRRSPSPFSRHQPPPPHAQGPGHRSPPNLHPPPGFSPRGVHPRDMPPHGYASRGFGGPPPGTVGRSPPRGGAPWEDPMMRGRSPPRGGPMGGGGRPPPPPPGYAPGGDRFSPRDGYRGPPPMRDPPPGPPPVPPHNYGGFSDGPRGSDPREMRRRSPPPLGRPGPPPPLAGVHPRDAMPPRPRSPPPYEGRGGGGYIDSRDLRPYPPPPHGDGRDNFRPGRDSLGPPRGRDCSMGRDAPPPPHFRDLPPHREGPPFRDNRDSIGRDSLGSRQSDSYASSSPSRYDRKMSPASGSGLDSDLSHPRHSAPHHRGSRLPPGGPTDRRDSRVPPGSSDGHPRDSRDSRDSSSSRREPDRRHVSMEKESEISSFRRSTSAGSKDYQRRSNLNDDKSEVSAEQPPPPVPTTHASAAGTSAAAAYPASSPMPPPHHGLAAVTPSGYFPYSSSSTPQQQPLHPGPPPLPPPGMGHPASQVQKSPWHASTPNAPPHAYAPPPSISPWNMPSTPHSRGAAAVTAPSPAGSSHATPGGGSALGSSSGGGGVAADPYDHADRLAWVYRSKLEALARADVVLKVKNTAHLAAASRVTRVRSEAGLE